MTLCIRILKAIKEAGADGIRVKDLCEKAEGTKSGILNILKSLREEGFVERIVGDVPKYRLLTVNSGYILVPRFCPSSAELDRLIGSVVSHIEAIERLQEKRKGDCTDE